MRLPPLISWLCRVTVHRSICRLATSVCTIHVTWRLSIINYYCPNVTVHPPCVAIIDLCTWLVHPPCVAIVDLCTWLVTPLHVWRLSTCVRGWCTPHNMAIVDLCTWLVHPPMCGDCRLVYVVGDPPPICGDCRLVYVVGAPPMWRLSTCVRGFPRS